MKSLISDILFLIHKHFIIILLTILFSLTTVNSIIQITKKENVWQPMKSQ